MANDDKRRSTLTAKTKKQTQTKNKYNSVDWKAQTEKVARFCKRRGFSVKFQKNKHENSTICFVENEILIHNGSTQERVFYSLLHEVGHLLIHENAQLYAQNTGFVFNNFSRQSLTTKIGEVEEEFDAWRQGYKKAKKMRLKVDRLEYEKLKASYLSTYFEWAIDRKIKKKIDVEVHNALKKAANKQKKASTK